MMRTFTPGHLAEKILTSAPPSQASVGRSPCSPAISPTPPQGLEVLYADRLAEQYEVLAYRHHPLAYTPRHLADKILASRSALEGERKQVTVLFADTAGFVALAKELDPEVVHEVMDHCFGLLTAEVHRFEGTINQYTGDGIMALLGAPIAHEDSPRRPGHAARHPGLRP